MAVFDLAQYKVSLKTKYNIPDEDLAAFDTEIAPGFLRQDAFSRRQQDLDRRQQDVDARFATLEPFEQYLQDLERRSGIPREQWTQEQVNFAVANQPHASQPPAPTSMTQAQIDALIDQRVRSAVGEVRTWAEQQLENTQRGTAILLDFIPEARDEWRDKYGAHGAFPKAEFEKFIGPDGAGAGIPLPQAWSLFKSPYDAKNQETLWNKRVQDAADEAYRRGRSESANLEPDPTGAYGTNRSVLGSVAEQDRAIKPGETAAPVDQTAARARFNKSFSAALAAAESGHAPQSS